MLETPLWVFFYGSYLNMNVLVEVNIAVLQWEVARLPGFDLRIAPRANLVRSERELGFPAWYVARIERFLPAPAE